MVGSNGTTPESPPKKKEVIKKKKEVIKKKKEVIKMKKEATRSKTRGLKSSKEHSYQEEMEGRPLHVPSYNAESTIGTLHRHFIGTSPALHSLLEWVPPIGRHILEILGM